MVRRQLPYVKQIEENRDILLGGTVLAIDPSVGSSSSMPGWAVYRAGELEDSGTFTVKVDQPLHARLGDIHEAVKNKEREARPDIVIIEHITKFGRMSVDSLLKGVGAILAAIPSRTVVVEIPPAAWHKIEPPGYYKTDEQDAIALGYYAIQKAKGTEDGISSKEQERLGTKTKQKEDKTDRLRTLRSRTTKKTVKTRTKRSVRAVREKLAQRGRVRRKPTSRRGKKSSSSDRS